MLSGKSLHDIKTQNTHRPKGSWRWFRLWRGFVLFVFLLKLERSTVIAFSVQAHRGKSLTLAGHAYWLIAGLAHTVVDGGAAGLGGVLGIRTGQAGTRASWSSLRFIGSRWTCCGGRRRCRFLSKKERKKLGKWTLCKRIQPWNWKITWQIYEIFHQMNRTRRNFVLLPQRQQNN